MKVCTGYSKSLDAEAAVSEATGHFRFPNAPISLLLAFTSTKQDVSAVSAALGARFPGVPIAGCTTAGEMVGGEHLRGSLAIMAIASRKIRAAIASVRGLGQFDAPRAQQTVEHLFSELDIDHNTLDPSKAFCLILIDGLCRQEEAVAAVMGEALGGVPLVGGSAGDDLEFKETRVLSNGGAETDAAVFILVHSEIPFEIVKHQHFVGTKTAIAITKADVVNRRVYEIDGYPAVEAYARALGLPREEVTAELAFLHPVTFACDGELYVRSIQKIEPDGSLVFYCAVEEGMVLDLTGHQEMPEALCRDLTPVHEKLGAVSAFIGFNCILRALEASGAGLHEQLGRHLNSLCERSIGFDTYGEQLHGLHMNQTLVGVAFAQEENGKL